MSRQNILCIIFICGIAGNTFGQVGTGHIPIAKIQEEILKLKGEGGIPGISIVAVSGDQTMIESYGYSWLKDKKPVSDSTLFEIGSCSKAFTALAVVRLAAEHKIDLDDYVSSYLPWFRVKYKREPVNITLRQLLHHTSGIPWSTISDMPETDSPDALEKTVRMLIGNELKDRPGKKYEYATINYDVLALIIQTVTGRPFEEYMQKNVFDRLGLTSTSIGVPKNNALLSRGYKMSFLRPREYHSPIFRGNNAAGYVISNSADMAKWLRFQLGMTDTADYRLAMLTQQRDETVALHEMDSYAMGWEVSLNGNGEIFHGGQNPNYTAYVAFRPAMRIGVVVLVNSNSTLTPVIGEHIIDLLVGEKMTAGTDTGDNNDKAYSFISLLMVIYLMAIAACLFLICIEIVKGKRRFAGFGSSGVLKLGGPVMMVFPVLSGIYFFPGAIAGFNWHAMIVWTPQSFMVMMVLILTAMFMTCFTYYTILFFPGASELKDKAPLIMVVSILSGIANMIIITLVTSALYADVKLGFMIFYFGLALMIYLLGRKYVQTSLIRFNTKYIYDLRIRLADKIFSTTYRNFEQLARGRVYTGFNEDVATMGEGASTIVVLVTNAFTVIAAFVYLGMIALWATMSILFLIISLSATYFIVAKRTEKYFRDARNSQSDLMRLVNGMIDGFKEISLQHKKRMEYKADLEIASAEYSSKISIANIRFVNAFVIGELLLIGLLGGVVFGLPKMFPALQNHTIMSFVIILLYLIGPITGILNSSPALMRIRVAWDKIQQFLKDIPSENGLTDLTYQTETDVKTMKIENLHFSYRYGDEGHCFSIGPIDLEVSKGEIVFIIGANGSGKTTFAKLITGLYIPDSGRVLINGKVVSPRQLGEYFSAAFYPTYLFEKLYNIETDSRSGEIQEYLSMLGLKGKVEIIKNRYSTIDLSSGQRKRLVLLQCYLETAPIYLFDEWAADQDPEYRDFFYRILLPEMKAIGKLIIVITHDERYFDMADKVVKMNEGRLEPYKMAFQHFTMQ